jgi:hypothetical protein
MFVFLSTAPNNLVHEILSIAPQHSLGALAGLWVLSGDIFSDTPTGQRSDQLRPIEVEPWSRLTGVVG